MVNKEAIAFTVNRVRITSMVVSVTTDSKPVMGMTNFTVKKVGITWMAALVMISSGVVMTPINS